MSNAGPASRRPRRGPAGDPLPESRRPPKPGPALAATLSPSWSLQPEYRAWLQALPDSLQERATAKALQAIDELDLDELEAIQPPKSFDFD
jgi:hypothetical protein